MATRWHRSDTREGAAPRAHAPRVSSIVGPLLVVATSLDEAPEIERCFGPGLDSTLLGVFTRSEAGDRVIDLRGEAPPDLPHAKPAPAVSLDRVRGNRRHTDEIARSIAEAIEGTDAATVAVGLGLLGGDDLEASDAALLARRQARPRIQWICYSIDSSGADAGRVARRRMALFVRGIRLEPIVIAEADESSTAHFWEIRAPHRY